jgi:hypothetical protein
VLNIVGLVDTYVFWLIFNECILLCVRTIYMFHFSCQTQHYTKNSLTFHCAQLTLLVVQCRYMFPLMEPSLGDTFTNLIIMNYASYMEAYGQSR